MIEAQVVAQDGVAVLGRGDAFLIVYERAARLHRTRWLFEQLDAYITPRTGTFIVFMLVLPTADPPDGPTRAENATAMRKYSPRLRRVITTPVGDAFRMSIVRAVMRALAVLQGKTGVHFITDTVDAGLQRVAEVASESTPGRAALVADIAAMHRALGVDVTPTTRAATGT